LAFDRTPDNPIAAELIGAVCGMALTAWLLRQPEEAAEPMNPEAQL
jgi:hypothetical protein